MKIGGGGGGGRRRRRRSRSVSAGGGTAGRLPFLRSMSTQTRPPTSPPSGAARTRVHHDVPFLFLFAEAILFFNALSLLFFTAQAFFFVSFKTQSFLFLKAQFFFFLEAAPHRIPRKQDFRAREGRRAQPIPPHYNDDLRQDSVYAQRVRHA